MKVIFKGGPADGQVRHIFDTTKEWLVPVAKPVDVLNVFAVTVPDGYPGYDVARYRITRYATYYPDLVLNAVIFEYDGMI